MDLRHLHYFIAVAEAGTFTGAAQHVHVAQSGISVHIKALERELGQQLFDRGPRAVRLTAAGAALLPHARAVMDALAAARESIDALTGLIRGHVAVGSVSPFSPHSIDLPEVLASFQRIHRGVDISLVEDTAAALKRRVSEGALDVAFTSLNDSTPAGVRTRELHNERVVAVVTPADPFAHRADLPLNFLGERPLIALPEGSGLRCQLDQTLARAGVRARIAFEAGSPDMLVRMVEKGLGVAVVPHSALSHNDRVVGVAVPELPLGRLGIIWRDGAASRATRAFVAHTTALAAQRPAAS
ncbi:LysR family transcriptional regulator [Nocardia rhizosphaerihabitans]|uniref:LysR family transcriptional regulator n=1 Tax=Nocardia rhizosphaerihabitans TaxID=1691570 RepID=A0ABQ2L233_9NOCA|nr:LysR family transcriptional regulator [Nocardia rhizosphaerihabitans]GGN99901.1 LysR family transcriptional regulator [Nocardia rhizosphaerihabitans]